MAEREVITHSIPPTYDEHSRVLVLGTIPSPKSREYGFNYGHPRNRFWQVMAQLAGEPVPTTNERKRDFCLRHHIALWDVLAECEIEGASDASIRNCVPNPLTDITGAAPIATVFCTGAKAYELYCKLCEDEVGIKAVKLPSTSPANAACGFDELLSAYAAVFEHEHAFEPPALDVPDVVALEQTIAANGASLAELMDRAGTALAHRVQIALDELIESSSIHGRHIEGLGGAAEPAITILCGNGNNGGDGWVAAACLVQAGRTVCLITDKTPEQIKAQPAHDAAVRALRMLEEHGARLIGPQDALPLDDSGVLSGSVALVQGTVEQAEILIRQARIVVDAIMGTGAIKEPRAPFGDWIACTNDSRESHAVIAADVPSGVSASDGQTALAHITADETVTMIVPKPGLVAPECGVVHVAPLASIEPYL